MTGGGRVSPRGGGRVMIDPLFALQKDEEMKLTLPAGPFRAYLFDCDGTIVDSMPLHYVAWTKALSKWNCEFAEAQFYALGGTPTTDIIAQLNRTYGLQMPIEEVTQRKEASYFENIGQLKAIPEVLEHIELGHGKMSFAVVSGDTRETVMASLRTVKLLDRFETLVCAGDYQRGKPDPEPFLMAAARLGVSPRDCLVFEDTDIGIRAATAAGMASVKVPPPWERSAG
jgi:HAD superfamily hydrolase (TIGR01509 family)